MEPREAETFPVLTEKVAIVTGAAQGMGRATALTFAKAGASVVVADVKEAEGHETVTMVEQAGGKAHFVKTNITVSSDVQNMVVETVATFGKLDVAVNNAALMPDSRPLVDFDEDHWNRIIAVNLTGTALCVKYELQQMRKQGNGGSIVNIASTSGFKPLPNIPAYTVAKHGVVGLTKCAAMENGEYGIRVNTIAPGAIHSEMSDATLKIRGTTAEEIASQYSYFKRLGYPHEVAQGSLWLASDASSYVTGITLPVDSGYLSR